MLFELGGRRKRFIQVIYVCLALLLGGSLVFFGIGGDAPGGLGDAIGISPNESGSTGNDVLDQDIDAANQTLQSDPDNQRALLTLARSHFLAGQTALTAGEQEAAITRYQAATDAWGRYLQATNRGERIRNPEEAGTTGTLVLRAYGYVPISQPTLEQAVQTAEIVTEERPSTSAYLDMAVFAYAAGNTELAESAGDRALAAVEGSERSTVEQQLEQAERQGRRVQRQLEAQAPTEEEFQNPLGGLGGSAGPTSVPPGGG